MENRNLIGITERGDAALDLSWENWVFAQKRPAILISKDPLKLYRDIMRMSDKCGFRPNIIVHCTITGFGGSKIEPNVPAAGVSLEGYHRFIDTFGKDRVVLRCDPLTPTEKCVVSAASKIMSKALGTRIRFSFLDMYDHVRRRFTDARINMDTLGIKTGNFHADLNSRRKLVELIKQYVADSGLLSACGEPGIPSEPCISKRDCDILGVEFMSPLRSQRFACGCAANKIELLKTKGQCRHGCLYCYWKTSYELR